MTKKTVVFSDLELPRASLMRILKPSINSKLLQKDAKTAISRATTVFISYLTASAQEIAASSGQKTLTANHLYQAIETIGFAEWIDILKAKLDDHHLEVGRKKQSTLQEKSPDRLGDGDEEHLETYPSDYAQTLVEKDMLSHSESIELDTEMDINDDNSYADEPARLSIGDFVRSSSSCDT